MMILAQRVENREIIRREVNLTGYSGGKYPIYPSNTIKPNSPVNTNDNKSGTIFSMRTITLRGVTAGKNKKEGLAKMLSNAEFQAKREKALCFRCDEKYH